MLYLVPTPIGNLADITLRALEVLKNVDLVLAEDTRTSGFLLKHYGIQTPLRSYHIHNEHQTVVRLVEDLKQGKNLALLSDAGTPGISDPGFLLIRQALQEGINIEALPGPSALLPALLKSGFPTDRFVFEGFLPHKKGRATRIRQLLDNPLTCIIYESPHRLVKLLEELSPLDIQLRRVSVSRELTKKFEETITGSVKDLLLHFQEHPPKGEFVLIIEAKHKK